MRRLRCILCENDDHLLRLHNEKGVCRCENPICRNDYEGLWVSNAETGWPQYASSAVEVPLGFKCIVRLITFLCMMRHKFPVPPF